MVALFRGTTGLNTRDDPVRFALQAGDTGLLPLAKCKNILIDATYRPSRCQGFTNVQQGAFSSLHSDGRQAVCVQDGYLCLLDSGGEAAPLTEVNSDRVSYADYMGRIYWTSGFEHGYVANRENNEWTVEDDYRPLELRDYDPQDYMTEVPIGHMLMVFNRCMFVATTDTVYISDSTFPGRFRRETGYLRFPSRVTMMARISDGIYVSDSESIWWFGGMDPNNWDQIQITDYPAIEGAITYVRGSRFGKSPQMGSLASAGMIPMIMTEEGVIALGPGGNAVNVTETLIETSKTPQPFQALYGAMAVVGQHVFITLEP